MVRAGFRLDDWNCDLLLKYCKSLSTLMSEWNVVLGVPINLFFFISRIVNINFSNESEFIVY